MQAVRGFVSESRNTNSCELLTFDIAEEAKAMFDIHYGFQPSL